MCKKQAHTHSQACIHCVKCLNVKNNWAAHNRLFIDMRSQQHKRFPLAHKSFAYGLPCFFSFFNILPNNPFFSPESKKPWSESKRKSFNGAFSIKLSSNHNSPDQIFEMSLILCKRAAAGELFLLVKFCSYFIYAQKSEDSEV